MFTLNHIQGEHECFTWGLFYFYMDGYGPEYMVQWANRLDHSPIIVGRMIIYRQMGQHCSTHQFQLTKTKSGGSQLQWGPWSWWMVLEFGHMPHQHVWQIIPPGVWAISQYHLYAWSYVKNPKLPNSLMLGSVPFTWCIVSHRTSGLKLQYWRIQKNRCRVRIGRGSQFIVVVATWDNYPKECQKNIQRI